jgi:hypothetical protein
MDYWGLDLLSVIDGQLGVQSVGLIENVLASGTFVMKPFVDRDDATSGWPSRM